MPIRETPPEKGRGRSRGANWSNLKVARGERHECYSCGKTHWIDCHTNYGVTQPCLKVVTDGELACPRCTEPVETMGYVAVWLASNIKPMFALVHHDQRERADPLMRGQPVWVGRDDHKTAGIYVLGRCDAKSKFLRCDTPSLLAAIDLMPTLLKVWKLPQLAVWAQPERLSGDNALSLDTTQPREVGASDTPDARRSDAQPYTPPDPLDMDDAYVETVNRVKGRVAALDAPPSTNGKPKKGG